MKAALTREEHRTSNVQHRRSNDGGRAMEVTLRRNGGWRPSVLFGDLPILRLRFDIRHVEGARLPKHKGSAWRGLIGWEVQRLVCPFDRRPACGACAIRDYCPYFLLFEGKSKTPGLLDAPRGYVLYAPPDDGDDASELYLTLAGRCAKFLPVFIKALFDGQTAGLGAGRFPYRVLSGAEMLPDGSERKLPADPNAHLDVQGPFPLKAWLRQRKGGKRPEAVYLMTPVRLRKQKKYLSEMDWQFFFGCLARRIEALNCMFNNGAPMGKDLWIEMQPRFAGVRLAGAFSWRDLFRYSSRQRKKAPMGGMVGRAVLNGVSDDILEWCRAAEIVHVGKGASMGMGKIEVF